jgi:hypothetical protein
MGLKLVDRRLKEKDLLLKCAGLCPWVHYGPHARCGGFPPPAALPDTVEDAIIEAKDFPCPAMTVAREGSAYVGEADEDLHMIKQSLTDFDGRLSPIQIASWGRKHHGSLH